MALLSTDIIDWALDANGDIAVGQDVSWTSGLSGVVQSCQIAVQMLLGEWFLNTAEGVPYFERPGVVTPQQALIGGQYNSLAVIAEVRDALLSVPQVVAILFITPTFDKTTGRLSVAWQVHTTFGDSPPQLTGTGGI